jgi:hypothetical protein
MREATRALYRAGVVAEVSGAAAVAAVLAGKLGDLALTLTLTLTLALALTLAVAVAVAVALPLTLTLALALALALSRQAGRAARPARGLHGVGAQHRARGVRGRARHGPDGALSSALSSAPVRSWSGHGVW